MLCKKMENNVDLHTFNILSICSGVGGLELGLKLAIPHSRTVAYVEGEAYATAILAKRISENALDNAPIWTDLRTFDGKPFCGKVDCIVGGYPCQPFSHAGHRKGADDPRHLWPVVAELIRTIKPPMCFFENVRGHLSLGFEQVANDLQRMGYAVKAGLFSAEEVGSTHRRERLFIMAYRDDNGRGCGGHDNEQRQTDCKQDRQHSPSYQNRLEPEFGTGTDSAIVADSSCKLGQRNVGEGNCKRRSEEKDSSRCGTLADTSCIGQRRGDGRICEGEKSSLEPSQSSGDDLPKWPPLPNDKDGWDKIPAHLKPAVLRTSDGMADRLDRIRACGNGVVPLVAAYAWRTLTTDLEIKWKKL